MTSSGDTYSHRNLFLMVLLNCFEINKIGTMRLNCERSTNIERSGSQNPSPVFQNTFSNSAKITRDIDSNLVCFLDILSFCVKI